MRVSFDIDGLLTPHVTATEYESPVWPVFLVRRYSEPLRQGSRQLFAELQRRGCEVWIYTTSMRTPFYVKLWLRMHGIQVRNVVNADIHLQSIRNLRFDRTPSKYPPMFGIDLHVDDSPGLLVEAGQNAFAVLIVSPTDENWTALILEKIGQPRV